MSYCAVADIQTRISKYVENMDSSVITEYIILADAMIDGRLKNKFDVPFTTVPALIKEISRLLTQAWIVRDIMQHYEDDKETAPERLEKKALSWLDMIAEGTLDIDEDPLSVSDTDLDAGGIGIDNIPYKAEDETKTNANKQSKFYLPSGEEPDLSEES